jgi:hypothetical protein
MICPECWKHFRPFAEWQKICTVCYRAEKRSHSEYYRCADDNPKGCFVDDVLLRQARCLCHPDRHAQSQLSVRVSQQLNRLLAKNH